MSASSCCVNDTVMAVKEQGAFSAAEDTLHQGQRQRHPQYNEKAQSDSLLLLPWMEESKEKDFTFDFLERFFLKQLIWHSSLTVLTPLSRVINDLIFKKEGDSHFTGTDSCGQLQLCQIRCAPELHIFTVEKFKNVHRSFLNYSFSFSVCYSFTVIYFVWWRI